MKYLLRDCLCPHVVTGTSFISDLAACSGDQACAAGQRQATDCEPAREVLDRVALGASDKEIAAQLAISLHTAKTHVRNILGKLRAANWREAAWILTAKSPSGY